MLVLYYFFLVGIAGVSGRLLAGRLPWRASRASQLPPVRPRNQTTKATEPILLPKVRIYLADFVFEPCPNTRVFKTLVPVAVWCTATLGINPLLQFSWGSRVAGDAAKGPRSFGAASVSRIDSLQHLLCR